MSLREVAFLWRTSWQSISYSQNLNVDCHENATHFLAMTAWGRFALRFGLPRFCVAKSRNDEINSLTDEIHTNFPFPCGGGLRGRVFFALDSANLFDSQNLHLICHCEKLHFWGGLRGNLKFLSF
ncbi:hypothetical protein ACWIUD_08160 [Helicobacter sp. 23-1044]